LGNKENDKQKQAVESNLNVDDSRRCLRSETNYQNQAEESGVSVIFGLFYSFSDIFNISLCNT
jgi:hypothetical protein